MEPKFKVPTETVELPSKGLLYPEGHPLAGGRLEMKYMTAKEEDILTNTNYIKNGTVIDKLLQSLIITEFDYGDLLVGDKNALMVAARVLSYGKDYSFDYDGESHTVDLSLLDHKELNPDLYKRGQNEFEFVLPATQNVVTFKILTHRDERSIEQEVKGLQKIQKDSAPEVTTRLKYIITSINGSREKKDVREFVETALLARDARALREEYNKVTPDINLTFKFENRNGEDQEASIPVGLSFFWPDI
jgi:hypothetical protein